MASSTWTDSGAFGVRNLKRVAIMAVSGQEIHVAVQQPPQRKRAQSYTHLARALVQVSQHNAYIIGVGFAFCLPAEPRTPLPGFEEPLDNFLRNSK